MSASKDPQRLLDYGDRVSDLLRGALDAERDGGDDAARLARIGRRIAAATAAVPPPPASPAPPPPAAAPKAAPLATKGPIIGIAAATLAGLVAIALVASRSPEAPIAPPPAPTTHATAPAPNAPPAPESTTDSVPTVSPADLPSAPERPLAKPPAKAAAPSEADEIALLGRAHDALRTSPADSLALCKEHEAKYASGHFAQEREAVAIEALVYLHRTDEARRRFAEFERRWPASSHRVHLESLLPR